MIRELAGHDPARYDAVLRWPLAEALIAYEARQRERAEDTYRFDWLVYVIAGGKKPECPAILRDE